MNFLNGKLKFIVAVILLGISNVVLASQTWKFKVYLDEKVIGEHIFTKTLLNENTHVQINAAFDVYFLFINAYSYRHSNYEVWNGECLQSITSTTDDNGEELYVKAENLSDRLQIKSSSGSSVAEGCVKTFAYWDPEFLKSKFLLNAQTGKLMPVSIDKIGEENIMVRNKPIPSIHYRLTTDEFTIDLWYSKKNEWLALNSTTSNGSTLRYQIQ